MTRADLAALEDAHGRLVRRLLQAPSPALLAEEAASAARLTEVRREIFGRSLDA